MVSPLESAGEIAPLGELVFKILKASDLLVARWEKNTVVKDDILGALRRLDRDGAIE